MDSVRREGRSSPDWTSPTNAAPFDRWRRDGARRAVLGALAAALCLHPSQAPAEGFGPFPVRNFNPLQQLVLNMPADRAAVLSQGTLDIRLELAETAAVYSELPANASAQMKFETLRTGLFLRYGVTSKLEVGFELPFLYRYTGVHVRHDRSC